MKKLIAEIPDNIHLELKLSAIEEKQTMKKKVNDILFYVLLNDLKVKTTRATTDKELSDITIRIDKLRNARHDDSMEVKNTSK